MGPRAPRLSLTSRRPLIGTMSRRTGTVFTSPKPARPRPIHQPLVFIGPRIIRLGWPPNRPPPPPRRPCQPRHLRPRPRPGPARGLAPNPPTVSRRETPTPRQGVTVVGRRCPRQPRRWFQRPRSQLPLPRRPRPRPPPRTQPPVACPLRTPGPPRLLRPRAPCPSPFTRSAASPSLAPALPVPALPSSSRVRRVSSRPSLVCPPVRFSRLSYTRRTTTLADVSVLGVLVLVCRNVMWCGRPVPLARVAPVILASSAADIRCHDHDVHTPVRWSNHRSYP